MEKHKSEKNRQDNNYPKKAYTKLALRSYGTITAVTGSQAGTGPDTMMGLTMGPVMPM